MLATADTCAGDQSSVKKHIRLHKSLPPWHLFKFCRASKRGVTKKFSPDPTKWVKQRVTHAWGQQLLLKEKTFPARRQPQSTLPRFVSGTNRERAS